MSALPPKAAIGRRYCDVRFVPKAALIGCNFVSSDRTKTRPGLAAVLHAYAGSCSPNKARSSSVISAIRSGRMSAGRFGGE